MIDSHCHLGHRKFETMTVAEVVAAAQAAGVDKLVTIATDAAQYPQMQGYAEAFESVYFAAGVHPHQAGEGVDEAALLAALRHPKCVGVGEAGLDYYYDFAPKNVQMKVFDQQIAIAQQTGLPLIIHTREAEDDTMAALTRHLARARFDFVLHCFTGTAKLAEFALGQGGYLSASGVITFKNSAELRAIFARAPKDKVLIETDAPYLAPTPHRGKTNQPAYVAHTLACLAEVWQVPVAEAQRQSMQNTLNFFKKLVA